ncbi:endosomal membrane protein [Amniculicola lignicola CBS 123094]|uniref:Transmembrane 9 superfamily member n=1 Tax=Amniculicola lignicola CBS 123094 TaxID=1392246 RepID=A0A6A5X191_9PLEO|nr:endosomal membrane protein [Amniculicola lignicola CBS 123094]
MHADVRRGVAWCSLLVLTQAFYIPGFSIKSYHDGETIPLFVNKVYSDTSELHFAYASLPFVCPPTGRIRAGGFIAGSSVSLNLGEILRGDRITVSDYELVMGNDEEVRYLCSKTIDRAGIRRTRELIKGGFFAEWIVDNLPGATSFQTTDKTRKYYAPGFKIGEERLEGEGRQPTYWLNNHVTVVMRYHVAPGRDGEKGKKVIVGFEIFPRSIEAGNRKKDGLPVDISNVKMGLELVPQWNSTGGVDETAEATLTIPYTYSVYFREEPNLEWQNRWDMYLQDDSANVHWLAIVNSLVIMALLTAVVAVVLTRTIWGDIRGYIEGGSDIKLRSHRPRTPRSPKRSSEKSGGLLDQLSDIEGFADLDSDSDPDDITGWKPIHGDVFRPPSHVELLAPLLGSGTQLLFMTVGLLVLSTFGILNPSFRGGYISVGIGLFIFAGLFSGYFSSRIYRTFHGHNWQKNVLVTASLVPGLLFATVFFLNLFVWMQASSNALPLGTLIALLSLWLFIQLPLVYIGGWYGYVVVGAYPSPIKPNVIPRQIPPQPWYTSGGIAGLVVTGVVPFLIIFVELLFVFRALWQDKSGFYYLFGFSTLSFFILFVVVVEVTVLSTYLHLVNENYDWQWHAFLTGASSAIWIFGALIWFFCMRLRIEGKVEGLLFFCYGGLMVGVYGLLMGTVGWVGAKGFVGRIYGAVKVD